MKQSWNLKSTYKDKLHLLFEELEEKIDVELSETSLTSIFTIRDIKGLLNYELKIETSENDGFEIPFLRVDVLSLNDDYKVIVNRYDVTEKVLVSGVDNLKTKINELLWCDETTKFISMLVRLSNSEKAYIKNFGYKSKKKNNQPSVS